MKIEIKLNPIDSFLELWADDEYITNAVIVVLVNTHKCFDQNKDLGHRCHIHAQCLDKESYVRLYEKSTKTIPARYSRISDNNYNNKLCDSFYIEPELVSIVGQSLVCEELCIKDYPEKVFACVTCDLTFGRAAPSKEW